MEFSIQRLSGSRPHVAVDTLDVRPCKPGYQKAVPQEVDCRSYAGAAVYLLLNIAPNLGGLVAVGGGFFGVGWRGLLHLKGGG